MKQKATSAVEEAANKLFDSFIHLEKSTGAFTLSEAENFVKEIFKLEAFFIVANLQNINERRLEQMLIKSYVNFEIMYIHFRNGVDGLKKSGIVREENKAVSLTGSGALLYNFLHDSEAVSNWLDKTFERFEDQVTANISKDAIRSVIAREEIILDIYLREDRSIQRDAA